MVISVKGLSDTINNQGFPSTEDPLKVKIGLDWKVSKILHLTKTIFLNLGT